MEMEMEMGSGKWNQDPNGIIGMKRRLARMGVEDLFIQRRLILSTLPPPLPPFPLMTNEILLSPATTQA